MDIATKRAPPAGPLVPLSLAMRGYGGGPKPWDAVMRAMLAGDLPFTTAGGTINAATLLLPADAARRCWRLPAGEPAAIYSQLDALDIANLVPKHALRLASLAPEGAGEPWSVAGAKLVAAVRDRMSHSEVVARSGWDPRRATALWNLIIGRGARPPAGIGWLREEIAVLAPDLCSLGPIAR